MKATLPAAAVGLLLSCLTLVGCGTDRSPSASEGGTAPSPSDPASQPTDAATSDAGQEADGGRQQFPDGTYVVGEEIPVGTYVTAGARDSSQGRCLISNADDAPNGKVKLTTITTDGGSFDVEEGDGSITIERCYPLESAW